MSQIECKNGIYMIKFSLAQTFKQYPVDTRVVILQRDKAIIKLVSYLFPKVKAKKCISGERAEC